MIASIEPSSVPFGSSPLVTITGTGLPTSGALQARFLRDDGFTFTVGTGFGLNLITTATDTQWEVQLDSNSDITFVATTFFVTVLADGGPVSNAVPFTVLPP